jgi:DNA-binding SARP family transcriptional activator
VRIGLLGAFEARDDAGRPVEVPGPRLRALLARLALDAGRLVTTQSLVDAIWGHEPPVGAGNALQSLVSRLRRALPPDDPARIESRPAGYRLSAAADATDVAQFERLAAEGRARQQAGDPDGAAGRFAAALALWRGAPLDGLAQAPFAGPAIARLTELRLRTVADHAELVLAAGRGGELVAALQELTLAYPLDERLRGLYLRALCAAGRPAEALTAFEDLRRGLAEALGTDPSPAVRDLHAAILRGAAPDPAAQPPAARPAEPAPRASPPIPLRTPPLPSPPSTSPTPALSSAHSRAPIPPSNSANSKTRPAQNPFHRLRRQNPSHAAALTQNT